LLLKRITINTAFNKSEILIGEDWKNFRKYHPGDNTVIITDDNILKLYGKYFNDHQVLSITPGEKSKNLVVINELAGKLLSLGIDRSGFIVGIGGGVVCDIAGFLASVYMRGIGFGFVSTSLLSQVDASVGGKNGVNVGSVKNIIGNINQPEFVICDQSMLDTLPDEEYFSGLAELIKTGFIRDSGLIANIESNVDLILKKDLHFLTKLIARSVEIKASVVNEDEKETGVRMILNFGHTFGHAIEANTGIRHGFAIAEGMMIAADISVENSMLPSSERERLYNLLDSFKLLTNRKISVEKMNQFLSQDKKKSGKTINFVLLEKTGKAIVKTFSITELIDYYSLINSR
jgi:3-dehydroquinate synthase